MKQRIVQKAMVGLFLPRHLRHHLTSSAPAFKSSNSRGVVGFGAACGFLLFVVKFNDYVQTYKVTHNLKKVQKIKKGFWDILRGVLVKTCDRREGSTVFGLSMCLLLRTLGSVWVSQHWGRIVGSIVTRDFRKLRYLLTIFAANTILLAFLNAYLKYYISLLKEQVREKITNWCHTKYMRPVDMIFYKANKVGDKIENCDHQITSDVDKFADLFSLVLSQSLKPVVDFLVYSIELSRVQGLTTPLTLYVWFALASGISTITLPPFGELAATEQKLEGRFRGAHSELITNCEQIAFLGGEGPEKTVLTRNFNALLKHCIYSINLTFRSEVLRQYLNKYFVTVIGLFLVARPVRLNMNGMEYYSPDQISQYFVSTWRNMEAIATSIQDLFELSNRVGKLSGLASRVDALMNGLEERAPVLELEIEASKRGSNPPIFTKGDNLAFNNVSVYKPDGTLLVKNLNFEVTRGTRVLVTGGNGCGKSSLFRIIRKLWPLVEGEIVMPDDKEIYFLTQVNFVPQGSLRDLVTYPHTHEEMIKDGRTDADVMDVLAWAHVSPEVIVDGRAELQFTIEGQAVRPKLNDVRDWQKDLSPGQKQKLAFARLFYHKPTFVVLDECTNGISPDVEQELYDRCTKLNLGIFSISHKIELKLFHDFELHYNGDLNGTWSWNPCSETRGKIL